MLLFKLGLVFNATIVIFGEWQESNHWLLTASTYIAFFCFIVVALAFTDECTKGYTQRKTDDGPP